MKPVHLILAAAIGALWSGLAAAQDAANAGEPGVDYAEFAVSQLRCIIGNNAPMGERHRARYNGIFEMSAPGEAVSPFVPDYAGFNLEHVFDARPRSADGDVFFEPRVAPMTFRRIDDVTAELYQPPTPVYGMESRTRFTLREPYYIDFEFTCTPHKPHEGGFFGIFWASYMNAPHNKSIYFLGPGATLDAPSWLQYCTQHHDHYSTVLHEDDPNTIQYDEGPTVLYNQISPLRYSQPFYYGRIRDMVLIYIFKPTPWLRFSHSPSGGGRTDDGTDTNPAWDFQMVVPDAQIGQAYTLEARIVYKPWQGRDDVLAEVKAYLGG